MLIEKTVCKNCISSYIILGFFLLLASVASYAGEGADKKTILFLEDEITLLSSQFQKITLSPSGRVKKTEFQFPFLDGVSKEKKIKKSPGTAGPRDNQPETTASKNIDPSTQEKRKFTLGVYDTLTSTRWSGYDSTTPNSSPVLNIVFIGRDSMGKSPLADSLIGFSHFTGAHSSEYRREKIRINIFPSYSRQKQERKNISLIKQIKAESRDDTLFILVASPDGFSEGDLEIIGTLLKNKNKLIVVINTLETQGAPIYQENREPTADTGNLTEIIIDHMNTYYYSIDFRIPSVVHTHIYSKYKAKLESLITAIESDMSALNKTHWDSFLQSRIPLKTVTEVVKEVFSPYKTDDIESALKRDLEIIEEKLFEKISDSSKHKHTKKIMNDNPINSDSYSYIYRQTIELSRLYKLLLDNSSEIDEAQHILETQKDKERKYNELCSGFTEGKFHGNVTLQIQLHQECSKLLELIGKANVDMNLHMNALNTQVESMVDTVKENAANLELLMAASPGEKASVDGEVKLSGEKRIESQVLPVSSSFHPHNLLRAYTEFKRNHTESFQALALRSDELSALLALTDQAPSLEIKENRMSEEGATESMSYGLKKELIKEEISIEEIRALSGDESSVAILSQTSKDTTQQLARKFIAVFEVAIEEISYYFLQNMQRVSDTPMQNALPGQMQSTTRNSTAPYHSQTLPVRSKPPQLSKASGQTSNPPQTMHIPLSSTALSSEELGSAAFYKIAVNPTKCKDSLSAEEVKALKSLAMLGGSQKNKSISSQNLYDEHYYSYVFVTTLLFSLGKSKTDILKALKQEHGTINTILSKLENEGFYPIRTAMGQLYQKVPRPDTALRILEILSAYRTHKERTALDLDPNPFIALQSLIKKPEDKLIDLARRIRDLYTASNDVIDDDGLEGIYTPIDTYSQGLQLIELEGDKPLTATKKMPWTVLSTGFNVAFKVMEKLNSATYEQLPMNDPKRTRQNSQAVAEPLIGKHLTTEESFTEYIGDISDPIIVGCNSLMDKVLHAFLLFHNSKTGQYESFHIRQGSYFPEYMDKDETTSYFNNEKDKKRVVMAISLEKLAEIYKSKVNYKFLFNIYKVRFTRKDIKYNIKKF